jgi:cupin 2 domain-containing protein
MNIFHLPATLPNQEIFEALIPDQGVLIERIISSGQSSAANEWYDQERDEWVVLLQGEAEIGWEDGRCRKLVAGDWLMIPAHQRHRVLSTSQRPACIWLAVHAKLR